MTSIADFTRSIGINIHLDATDSGYGDVALVQASLTYLGIGLVRDHAYDIDLPAFRALSTAGTTFDLILDDDPKAELDALTPIYAAIRFLEGPNEVDQQPILTNGIADPVLAAIAEQASVAAALAATPALLGTPLIAPSLADIGNLPAFAGTLADATVANLHAYGAYGDSPGIPLSNGLAALRSLTALPVALTETGYYTMPTDDSGVDESVQARLTLDTLFDGILFGLSPVILYELLDEAADPGNTDGELHYGLFRADGSPKPAATALHDLTTILTASDATPGTAQAITLSLPGAPAGTHAITLSGAAGSTVAAIWAEPPIWDPVTHTEIAPPQTPTLLELGTTIAEIAVYDPLTGTAPIATYADASSLTVLLTDHPLLIKLTNPPTPVATPTPATGNSPPETQAATPPTTRTSTPATSVASNPDPVPETASADPTIGVYRFFDTTNGTHFYTASAAEAQTVQQTRPDLVAEGTGLRALAAPDTDPAAAPVYRFFDTASGTHFFTASTTERDTVIATRADLHYEPDSIFYEHTTAQPGDTPVYRFFDTAHGTHFYTDAPAERAAILQTRPDLIAEGIGFYEPAKA